MLDGVQSCAKPVCAEAGAVLTAEQNCCALHAACLVATCMASRLQAFEPHPAWTALQ